MPELISIIEDEDEFWKDALYEIISTMNVWDIDIVKLANEYTKKIESMKNLNFRIPAKALIVCAVLLRMKADILMLEENKDDKDNIIESNIIDFNNDEEIFNENSEKNKFNIPEISLIPKRVLKQKISAEELINAINEVLKSEKKERKKKKETIIEIKPPVDIRESVKEIYEKIIKILNEKNVVAFSQIVNKENLIRSFMSLLFLSNEGKILLKQEKIYNEILIMKP